MLILTNPTKWWRINAQGATESDRFEFEAFYCSIFKARL